MRNGDLFSTPNNPTIVSTVSSNDMPTVQNKKTNHRRRRRSIILEFCLNTSTHGLPGIARSESVHNRLFWTFSFLGFTIIMIFFVIKAIIAYLKYPTQINVDIPREWSQIFPAMSLCNASPFRLDRFVEPFLNYTNTLNFSNVYNANTVPNNLTQFITRFLIDQLNANTSLDYLYYSLPSILFKCTFDSIPCSPTDFIPFYSSVYGLCYTFNPRMKNGTNGRVRYGNENGGNGALELELYAHSYQYIPYFGAGAGFVALVHDNAQAPLIETGGIYLEPGRHHKLDYKKKSVFLLSAPYSTCSDNVPLPMKVMFDGYYHGADYGYSEIMCYGLCSQAYLYEQCGCINPYYWSFRSLLMPGTNKVVFAPLCYQNAFNSCYANAIKTFLQVATIQTKYCSYCTQPCTTIEYLIQKSALVSPLEWQMQGIKRFVENSTIPVPSDWSTAWKGHIQNNYLALSVVRGTATVENITQSAQLSFVDVISNIGGQTGLWIGISFLSLMEFIEMLYRLIRYQCHVIRSALERRVQSIST